MPQFLHNIAKNKKVTKPVIYGLSSTQLTDEEKYFFSKSGAVGFIIFSRNISNKDQLKNLTNSIREIMEGEVLILIDQEGGRVARMTEPHWKKYPSGKYFADLYQKDQSKAKEEIFNNFCDIGKDLLEVGINVDCAPVLDILTDSTHDVIGDRAYGRDVFQVSELGRKVCEGLLNVGVYPVIKHIPGHGRASSDSHMELPIVDTKFVDLLSTDFAVFKNFSDQKFAMTAHVLYKSIDEKKCATLSKKIINLIRNEIGFKNILMSDDVSMKALSGTMTEKTQAIIESGCDIVLHCNGNMQEMQEIDKAICKISNEFLSKFI